MQDGQATRLETASVIFFPFQKVGSSEKLVSPTARLMRGWFPPTVNPEGIASSSPGLRGTSYPGKSCKPRLNPNGVVAALDTLGHNSDGVGSHWRGVPATQEEHHRRSYSQELRLLLCSIHPCSLPRRLPRVNPAPDIAGSGRPPDSVGSEASVISDAFPRLTRTRRREGAPAGRAALDVGRPPVSS